MSQTEYQSPVIECENFDHIEELKLYFDQFVNGEGIAGFRMVHLNIRSYV